MGTIDTVVSVQGNSIHVRENEGQHLRSHHRPRLSIPLGNHKGHEVHLAQGAGREDAVVRVAVVLLVIGAVKI